MTEDSRCGATAATTLRLLPLAVLILASGFLRATALDLGNAVIVSAPGLSTPEQNAIRMLVEEVEKRTLVRWREQHSWPGAGVPVIAVGSRQALDQFAGSYATELRAARGPDGAEGFRIQVKNGPGKPTVLIVGNDARGVLFGVGRLLRELHMRRGGVSVDDGLEISTAPKYPLRGHQLGYRPKTHSYDAWDLPVWEQYYRDLAVFGCNAVELIPPRSDDAADSPHFPRPPMEMMIGMSRLADAYGLDVWVWYPALDKDYSDPKTVEFALREWGEVLAKLPRVDAVFVPGGDPGHTQPKHLMALLEKQKQNLRRFHPKAQMWVSPQGFTQAWMDEFLGILGKDQPTWLDGLVFGPQVRLSLAKLRELAPARYPIRHYPDITHSRQCQFPVPEWDVAYAVTEAREGINPRPEDQAAIFRKMQPDTIGFISYSEGCNDDVNKTVWSALGWDPDAKVGDILRGYARYFIGEKQVEDFAEGLLALERNWRGPLAANDGVDATLRHFQALEKAASPRILQNWRFQQALYRAYYDAAVRRRLISETEQESRAMARLREASSVGAVTALADAEKILERAENDHVLTGLRMRVHELAALLFQSISMQLSVEKYKAIAVDRGANLDTLDFPLNNRTWLKARFEKIRSLSSEADHLKAIQEIVEWTNPGPGGFYDDLGNVAKQPHLVTSLSFAEDPSRMQSVRIDFEEDMVWDEPEETAGTARRISWIDHAESLYDTPLRMRYTGLDPKARYKLRLLYGGDNAKRKIRLVANGSTEIHPYLTKPYPFSPIEFSIPAAATVGGELDLTWFAEQGLGGNGRGCQVSEAWLIRESSTIQP
jgi:hypothetical protein